MLQDYLTLNTSWEWVRSFQTDNVRSVGKRAVKLLAFKSGGLKKKFDGWQHFKDSFTLSK